MVHALLRIEGIAGAGRGRRLAGRYRGSKRTASPQPRKRRVTVLHRAGPRGLGRSYVEGMQAALRSRRDPRLPDGRGLLARSGGRSSPAGRRGGTPTSSLDPGMSRADELRNWPRRRLLLSAFANWPTSARSRACRSRTAPAASGAGTRRPARAAAAATEMALRWLRVPGGNGMGSHARRRTDRRSPHHLRGAPRGLVQDVGRHHRRVDAAAVAAARAAARTPPRRRRSRPTCRRASTERPAAAAAPLLRDGSAWYVHALRCRSLVGAGLPV